VLRLGFLANFLSHPVIAGFITASGIIIAASQLKHVLGIRRPATTCMNWSGVAGSRISAKPTWITLAIGAGDGLPVLGAQGAEAVAHRHRHEAAAGRHHRQGGAGGAVR
jgi:hypothetical protein